MRRVTFSIPWPFTPDETRDLLSFAFQVSLVSYLGFTLIENIWPGFVSLYFNLNIWLYAAIATGVLSSIWPAVVRETKPKESMGWPSWIWMGVLAVVSFLVVWYKTKTLGNLSLIIAILSGLIVFLLSWLVYTDDEQSESHPPKSDEGRWHGHGDHE